MPEVRKTEIPAPKPGSPGVKGTKCPRCGSDRLETADATEEGLLRTKYIHPGPIAAISFFVGYAVWAWIFIKLKNAGEDTAAMLSNLETVPALTGHIRFLKAYPGWNAVIGGAVTFLLSRKLIGKQMRLFYDDGTKRLRQVARKGVHTVRYTCTACKEQFEISYSSAEWMNYLWRERERKSDMDAAGHEYLPSWAAGLGVLGDLFVIYAGLSVIILAVLEQLGKVFFAVWTFLSNLPGNG